LGLLTSSLVSGSVGGVVRLSLRTSSVRRPSQRNDLSRRQAAEGVREQHVAVLRGVLVAERSRGALVPCAVHELRRGGSQRRRPRQPGVPQVVQIPSTADLRRRLPPPRAHGEVAVLRRLRRL
jgi:hypothetical protein